jgi:acetoin utilization deacetylase AcuC-like enzyme
MTILFTDRLFEEHETGQHPENPHRLEAIRNELAGSDVLAACPVQGAGVVEEASLQAVHPAEYVRKVRELAEGGGGRLDPDTVVSPRSYDVARHAAGTACRAVDQVLARQAETPPTTGQKRPGSAESESGEEAGTPHKHQNALCLLRPPGHHALPSRGMGFCLFNNVAVAARHARRRHSVERILIIDWDVHHGNGTQDIFYEDGQVVFFSIHRFPFYPGTGNADETGKGEGLGATFNVPVSFGTSRKDYFAAFEATLEKAVERARPELILISAGFDAHRLDPIGSLGLETEDFGRLTERVMQTAQTHCEGRIVSLLEGGYHPQALGESVRLHLETLAGSVQPE